MRNQQNDFLIQTNFLTITIISLSYYCENIFMLKNTWMTGKNWQNQVVTS